MKRFEGAVIRLGKRSVVVEERVVYIGSKKTVHIGESMRCRMPEQGSAPGNRPSTMTRSAPPGYDTAMTAEGIIVKMPVTVTDGAVDYRLRLEQPRQDAESEPEGYEELQLNAFVGRAIRIEHTGGYVCTRCGRHVDKLFGEGFCYPCFRDAPEAAECIVKPELCEAHLGRGRDPVWEEAHHNQPHAVYLAVTSAIKVGVTRQTQIPTRWVDQGAAWAVQIAAVPYRQLAGRIEVALKELYTDRTAWQRMLKGEVLTDVDVPAEFERIRRHFGTDELAAYLVDPDRLERFDITYPIRTAPKKVRSVGLQKTPVIESTLEGIRGQYLIFEDGAVFNVRRHAGFVVQVEL